MSESLLQELQKAVINAAGRHDLAKEITRFEISSVAHHIRCPTLLTKAEGDPIAAGSHTLYEGITLSKDIRGFSLAEGSGGHWGLLHARCTISGCSTGWMELCFSTVDRVPLRLRNRPAEKSVR